MKKFIRLFALVVSALLIVQAAAVPAFAIENTPTAEEALMQTPDGFDNFDVLSLTQNKKFNFTDNNNVSFNPADSYSGAVIEGKVSGISKMRFELADEADFGEMKVSRFVVNGVTQRKARASLKLFIDGAEAAEVALPKQNKKGTWTVDKTVCADLTSLKLTGKHKIGFAIKFDESVSAGTSTSLLLRSFFFTAETVPVMDISIDESEGTIAEMNNDPDHLTECYGSVTLNVPDGYHSEYSDKKYSSGTYELEYIRGRGNSTWMTDKKPYKLKFEKKQDFFGMGASKHWVLLANYYDFTMLRNKYTYWLTAKMGMEYTPQCVFIDLVMNGQYLGSYYLCEQIRIGKSVVDIDDLEDSPELSEGNGITGGYLLSLDYGEGEYRNINTEHTSFYLENPDFTDYVNLNQYNYIKKYLQDTEDAIYGKDFKNSEGKHYSEYLDLDAAADYYLIQEFSLNGDAFGNGSTYLYKKRGGKLYWGPLWDFDYVAWGATEYSENYVQGFQCNYTPWFSRLLTDPAFMEKIRERWQRIKPLLEESAADGNVIDKYALELYMSQKVNYYVNGTEYSGSTYYDYGGYPVGAPLTYIETDDNYEEPHVIFDTEVQRFKRWIRERLEWFDENLESVVPVKYNFTFKVDGKVYDKASVYGNEYISYQPEPPTKDGYLFGGWYTKDEYGQEISLEDYSLGEKTDITFKAVWNKISKSNAIKKIAFPYKDIYVYGADLEEGYADSYSMPLSIMPFDRYANVKYEVSDPDLAYIDANGYLTPLVYDGTVKVTASIGKLKATCTVHIGEYGEDYNEFVLKKSKITITKGSYSQVRLKYAPTSIWELESCTFTSADESIVEVDSNGFIYGKKAGTTVVALSKSYTESGASLLFCKVTVKPSPLKKGSKFTSGSLKYKVTKIGKTGTVSVIGAKSKTINSIKIPATVKSQGKKFKVTAIAAKAFNGFKKLKKVTIVSKTISKIGKGAFAGTPKSLKFVFPKSLKSKYAAMVKKSK